MALPMDSLTSLSPWIRFIYFRGAIHSRCIDNRQLPKLIRHPPIFSTYCQLTFGAVSMGLAWLDHFTMKTLTTVAYFQIPYRTHCHFRYKTFLSRHGSDCRVNATGAAPHVGRQVSLKRHWPNFWIDRFGPHAWPARSPDPSPLDYFLWGVHEGHGRYSKNHWPKGPNVASHPGVRRPQWGNDNIIRKATNYLLRRANCAQSKAGVIFNPLNSELNPICYLLALLKAHHFLHVSRIWVKILTFRQLRSYIYGAPILDVSRSHTTTQHSR